MLEPRKFVIRGIPYLACSALLLASRFCYLSKSTDAGVRQPAGRYERLKSRELGYSAGEPNGNAPRLNRVWGFFVPLVRNLYCQVEYGYRDSDTGMPCGKTAVGKCSDCGSAICSDCCVECCGDVNRHQQRIEVQDLAVPVDARDPPGASSVSCPAPAAIHFLCRPSNEMPLRASPNFREYARAILAHGNRQVGDDGYSHYLPGNMGSTHLRRPYSTKGCTLPRAIPRACGPAARRMHPNVVRREVQP